MQALARTFPANLRAWSIVWLPGLALGFLVLFSFVQPRLPSDDAMRHIVAHAWGYSHLAMYPLSTQTAYSQYPLFDWAAGALAQAVGAMAALKLLQAAAAALVVTAVYRAFRTALSGEGADRRLDAVTLTLLVLWAGLFHRVLLARPEVFALGWAVYAVSVHGSLRSAGFWAWLLAGVVASGSYWLAWLVWPLVLVTPWAWRLKAFALGVLGTFHLTFWLLWTDGSYWHVVSLLSSWNEARQVSVREGASALHLLHSPGGIALLALAIAGWQAQGRAARWHQLVAEVPYLALNMVRYASAMLLVLHASIAAGWQRLALPVEARLVLALVLTVALVTGVEPRATPTFKLPEGSRVLTPFGPATFALPMSNPGTVETLPAMEVGASLPAVQAAVRQVQQGTVPCSALKSLQVTHLVEDRLSGVPAECLRLVQVQERWRLWEVR